MKAFSIGTEIIEYGSIGELIQSEQLGAEDLMLISEGIWKHQPELAESGVQVIFPREFGKGEPTDAMIDGLLKAASEKHYKRIIAIGGGAILDMAKLVAVAEPGDNTDAIFDRADRLKKHCSLTLIPTTCGTGSEVTNISVVNRISKGTKMGLAQPALFADRAVLIPELAGTMPYMVFATSSIDAMVHSVESFLSPNRCSISEMFSEKALRTILRCWKETVRTEDWHPNALNYLRAATWAGIGFGYGGCAAVHACAYPLGAVHHIPHGQSNQLMFGPVMRTYRAMQPEGRLNDLEKVVGEVLEVEPAEAIDALLKLMDQILPGVPLENLGVAETELPVFAANVIASQQRLLRNNYIPLEEADLLEIYRDAF